jgi:hypothetical protein
MKLGYSDGPVSSLEVRNVEADWERIAERLTHRAGPKDGSYLVRGPCAPERRDRNLHEAHLLVLDGDKGMPPETGELVAAPGVWTVHEALDGYQHVVTTSHSHRPEAPRWRLWMPTDAPFSQEQCKPLTEALHARLVAAGCPVALSHESYRWSQAWFLPRHPGVTPERYQGDGEPVCVVDLLAEAPPEAPKPSRVQLARPSGRIADFNASHDLQDMLSASGYQYRGQRKMADGTPATAYLHPHTETGIPGTFVFQSRAGKQVVLSFATNDPLHVTRNGKPTYLDAWDAAQRLV